jgi:hypothetical protein
MLCEIKLDLAESGYGGCDVRGDDEREHDLVGGDALHMPRGPVQHHVGEAACDSTAFRRCDGLTWSMGCYHSALVNVRACKVKPAPSQHGRGIT